MSEIGKKKKNKKRKHKLLKEDEPEEDEYKLVKKKKRKHKHRTGGDDDDGDNVTSTLLVSVDVDETRFLLLFSPNITTWEMFAGKSKETCEINPKHSILMKEKTYKTFCEYVQSHQHDDHFLVSIYIGIKHNTYRLGIIGS